MNQDGDWKGTWLKKDSVDVWGTCLTYHNSTCSIIAADNIILLNIGWNSSSTQIKGRLAIEFDDTMFSSIWFSLQTQNSSFY